MSQVMLKMFVLSVFLLMGATSGFAQYGEAPAATETAVQNETADAPVAMEAMAPAETDNAAAEAPVAMEAAAPAAQPEMTEEQKAMQARMQEYTTVNANHDVLKSFEGKWTTSMKFWMDPAGPAEESVGTSESKVIMGGRYVEQTFSGTAMGQPFEGRGLIGYDNMKKEYTSIWFDNMGTGIMKSSAQYDAATKTLAEEGSMSCPITNETNRQYKAKTTIVDADHYTYETFMKDKDGNEFKSMEIMYTRAQ